MIWWGKLSSTDNQHSAVCCLSRSHCSGASAKFTGPDRGDRRWKGEWKMLARVRCSGANAKFTSQDRVSRLHSISRAARGSTMISAAKHLQIVRGARRFRIKRNTSQSDQTGNSFLLIRPGVVVVLHNLSFRLNKTMIFRETH